MLVIYAERNYRFPPDDEPLAIIPPPGKIRGSFRNERDREKLLLSKLLYDIRDAFRNILQAVHPHDASERGSAGYSGFRDDRVRRLTALCASVLGQRIEDQVEISRAEKEKAGICEHDDLGVLSEYYEAIPEHHRRCVT
jgi:hypothetical protein